MSGYVCAGPIAVGTGWSRMVSSQILKQLDYLGQPEIQLTKPVRKPKLSKFSSKSQTAGVYGRVCCGSPQPDKTR
jgi:hypothetical protein